MKRKVRAFKEGSFFYEEAEVPEETSLTIYLNSKKLATIASSPHDLKELVVGFLFTEGIIDSYDDITDIEADSSQNFFVTTRNEVSIELARTRILTSGCAGADIISSDLKKLKPISNLFKHSYSDIASFVEKSLALFADGRRGIHRASALLEDGQIIVTEDIGRHNAVDKLAGKILLNRVSNPKYLFATGRLSSEMVIKAVRMGAKVAVSLSSPTSTSITLAENYNLVLIGYARKGSFKIYTFFEKIE